VGFPYDILGPDSSYGAGSALDKDNLFDNDSDTYFDTTASDSWVGIDFGEGNEKQIVSIAYVLRNWAGYAEYRVSDCTFQGSLNDATFVNDTEDLYVVPATVNAHPTLNVGIVTNTTAFRYVRLQRNATYPLYAFAELDFITADEVTDKGTWFQWLDYYYDVSGANPSNFLDYADADLSDTDGDGLPAYAEYSLNGDPTDATSPLGVANLYAWPEEANANVVRWDASDLADAENGGGYIVYRSLEAATNYTAVALVTTNMYTDTDVVAGESYYYKASATNATYSYESELSDSDVSVAFEYDIFGVMAYASAVNSRWFYELFDRNLDTFIDDNTTGGYAGVDFGAAQQIGYVAFRLRNDTFGTGEDYEIVIDGETNAVYLSQSAVYGNTFEGSNDTNGTWTVLATITNFIPEMVEWNLIEVTDATAYRYVRYVPASANNNYATADIEFLQPDEGYTANDTLVLWLEEYGLTTADDELDTDSDGHKAWQEYVADTDPTDGEDVLKITQFDTTNGVVVSWNSVVGKSYNVVESSTLTGTGTVVTNVSASATSTSYTNAAQTADTVFYKIGVAE
jgi:hypothetical protein